MATPRPMARALRGNPPLRWALRAQNPIRRWTRAARAGATSRSGSS